MKIIIASSNTAHIDASGIRILGANRMNIKVVIITNLGQRQNQHKMFMLKMQKIFPKLYRCLLYVVFHNSEHQNQGFVDFKRDLH